ncbi:MAG: carbon-nitrogen hydrolase family protein [Treponema sp.]|nr:carbon-nitrogen hydrolase family protein [Treponema sp.]
MKIKVALAQIPVTNNIAQNLQELKAAVDYAGDEKADILLTPEASLSGYSSAFDKKEATEAIDELTAKAKALTVGLALGTCMIEKDGLCYNELRFYQPDGSYLGCHTKQLLCGSLEEPPKGEIEYYKKMPLQVFNFIGITVGGLICNDMWANPMVTPTPDPHLTHLLAAMGAKVIFHAVNGGRDNSSFSQGTIKKFHEVHLLMNSIANHIPIVSVDNAYPLETGVSSKGGIVTEAEWVFSLPDKGRQYGSYMLNMV